jgi:hypothetical protein
MTPMVVPGRPAADGLTWWVYAPSGAPPAVGVWGASGRAGSHSMRPVDVERCPGAFLVATTGLTADAPYTLWVEAPGYPRVSAAVRTLPGRLAAQASLNVAVGSCYSVASDDGSVTTAFPPPMFAPGRTPLHLRLLVGDQIYLDSSAETGGPIVSPPPSPFPRYLDQWQREGFRRFLAAVPSLFLADDHEFWNDYPHGNVWLPWSGDGSSPLAREMARAYGVFQAALNLHPRDLRDNASDAGALTALLAGRARTFTVDAADSSVPIFVLDTRTKRTRFDAAAPHFTDPSSLALACAWVARLPGPGVMVLTQPLVDKPAGFFDTTFHTMGDVNLPDYASDFAALWTALLDAPHDVLVVTGDIHWSRLYQASRDPNRRTIYELVSSPLARLSLSGAPHEDDVARTTGRVELPSGPVYWTRRFSTGSKMAFATVQMTPLSPAPASPVDTQVLFWRAGERAPAKVEGGARFTMR